jgi:hypothetical protein
MTANKEVTMNTTHISKDQATTTPATKAIDMRLEVVTIPVSDTDRAKEFYLGLGWRQDVTPPGSGVVQITPTGSGCSIHFGTDRTSAEPGSAQNLFLIVSDIQVAHEDLVALTARRADPIPSVAATPRWPRSAIPTAIAGCSRRSRPDFPAVDSARWT